MKKIAILLLALVACEPTKEQMTKDGTFIEHRKILSKHASFIIVTIDSCEYIVHSHSIIHKANCKNHGSNTRSTY